MQKNNHQTQEISSLEQLRKELKVHARSFKADLKTEWQRIEKDWKTLRKQVSPAKRATQKSATEIKGASELLLKSVKRGYARIKRALPTQSKSTSKTPLRRAS